MAAKVAGVALGWTAFSVTHLTLSHPPIRKDVIDKIGKGEGVDNLGQKLLGRTIHSSIHPSPKTSSLGFIPLFPWPHLSRQSGFMLAMLILKGRAYGRELQWLNGGLPWG